jgi:uncharacterized Rmd1/YagE family protein
VYCSDALQAYPDVLYGKYSRLGEMPIGDIFYFDYGCVAFWGLTQKQEQVQGIARLFSHL